MKDIFTSENQKTKTKQKKTKEKEKEKQRNTPDEMTYKFNVQFGAKKYHHLL